MNTDHQLLKQIAATRRGRTHLYPLLASSAILALFWVALWKWIHDVPRSTEVSIALLGLLCALLTYRLMLRVTRKNLHQTAVELDSDLDAHNQLETMVELKDTQHPLRGPQEQRTQQELGQFKPAPWSFLLGLATLLLCVVLGGVSQQLFHFGGGSIAEIEKPDIPDVPKTDEFAQLNLTKPESERRMKPMDEVVWEGSGHSSNGFDDLHLAVFLNGEPAALFPIEGEALGQPGEVALSGSFFLDELDATPFDVISYHLTAHSKVNDETALKVVSIPKFIEVRPFREDLLTSEEKKQQQGDDKKRQEMTDILDMIHSVLEFELTLNKAVFAARASGLANDNPLFLEQINLVKLEQKQLKETLNEFLSQVNPEMLTPNMTVSLRAAEDCMDAAAKKLEQLVPADERSDTI